MAQPILYRTLLVSSGPDDEFGLTQTVPTFSAWPVQGAKSIIVTMVPYKADKTVSSGTVDLQLIGVGVPPTTPAFPNPDALVTSAPVEAGVAVGAGVSLNVAGMDTIYIAVTKVSDLDASAVTVRLFITGVE